MASAFDRSLELRELRSAGEAYAERYGEPGSPGYRAAWLRFRTQVRTIDELQRRRHEAARKRHRAKRSAQVVRAG